MASRMSFQTNIIKTLGVFVIGQLFVNFCVCELNSSFCGLHEKCTQHRGCHFNLLSWWKFSWILICKCCKSFIM